jgi:hypothetical protein
LNRNHCRRWQIAETPQTNDKPQADLYDERVHAEVLDDLELGDYGYRYRMVGGVVMPPFITPARYQLSRTIETRPGDLCFTSFPKSGSTWLSYILLLLTGDGETPTDQTLRSSLHWVASSWPYPRSRADLDALPSPRIFKSHMPYAMALGGAPTETPCKHLYIARNPKDVAVSYYHFESSKGWSGNYNGPWEHWLEMFIGGRVQRGDWFDHVLSWWAHRDATNVLFLKYEDLVNDFRGQLDRIAAFLGRPLSETLAETIAERTSFDVMKKDRFTDFHDVEEIKGFFRKGRIGSWRDQFTADESERFDALTAERMAGSGLTFEFE